MQQNQATKENMLGTADVKTLLKQLAIPAITAQVVNVLYNVVDRMYIGHIPEVGSLALTGVGVCMPLIMLISALRHWSAWEGHLVHLCIWEKVTKKKHNVLWATVL